jgi:hypothetical protein
LGDHKSENLWQIFYQFDIDLFFLKDYVLNNYKKHSYFSYIADTLLCNTFILKPETKFQVTAIYKELLEYIDSLNPDNDFIDDEFNGALITSCIDLNLRNLLPIIEKLYKEEKVEELWCGDIEDVKYEFNFPNDPTVPQLLSSTEIYSYFEDQDDMFDRYDDYYDDEINDFWGDEPEMDDPYHGMPPFEKTMQPKVNRNDPCPCGSGKKFKKCCLQKNLEN